MQINLTIIMKTWVSFPSQSNPIKEVSISQIMIDDKIVSIIFYFH